MSMSFPKHLEVILMQTVNHMQIDFLVKQLRKLTCDRL